LIKAVEGFEDFTTFGKKQLGDLGVSGNDVVFAIHRRRRNLFRYRYSLEGRGGRRKSLFRL
jgi:hypothetical protein